MLGAKFAYLKVRDRASYAFALVSVAAALHIEGGLIQDARLVLAESPISLAVDAATLLRGAAPSRGVSQVAEAAFETRSLHGQRLQVNWANGRGARALHGGVRHKLMSVIGQPLSRVDGVQKITGTATIADMNLKNQAHRCWC